MAHERRQYAGAAPATTLNGAISNSITSIILTDGTGYPDGSVGPFFIIIDRGLSTEEKIKCTSRSGNTIVATGGRAADGTAAFAHANAAAVEHVFTATDADEANSHYASTSLDHHTQYTKADGTRAFTGVTAIAAAPGASAVGDSAAAGTANTLTRSDHRHGREAFGGAGGEISKTGTGAGGAATTPSRSDHTHPFNPPMARVFHNASHVISSGGFTELPFASESFDTDTMHSTVSNTGRLVATTAGKYTLIAYVSFPSNATGIRAVQINNTAGGLIVAVQVGAVNGGATTLVVSGIYAFAAGEYATVEVFQSSGGNLTIATGETGAHFSMHWIGP